MLISAMFKKNYLFYVLVAIKWRVFSGGGGGSEHCDVIFEGV